MNKRLLSIGDIHGSLNSLKELVENKIQLQKNDKLILLGDYIDRGDQSKEVIDYIIELKEKGFDVKIIIHGHNPISIYKCKKRVLSKLNVINIDTGCVYNDKAGYGILAAYECYTERILFV